MIAASGLTKRYPGGHEALRDVGFEVSAGEMVFITGHSGAGKSTLVKLVAAIERPTSGSLVVNGQNLAALRKAALPYLRRHFGLVFQDQKLLFDRTVLDNVLLPLEIVGLPRREAVRRAQAALDSLNVSTAEQKVGVAIVRRSIEEPLRQIIANAGGEPSVVVNKVRDGKGGFGFNARTGQYVDLIKDGVIDPTKVVRTALQNAASVAGMMLTTEAMIAEKPKKEAPAAPAPGGMGGMDM